MKGKQFYRLVFVILLLVIGVLFYYNHSASQEELFVKSFYPEAKSIQRVKDSAEDIYIAVHMPAVKRAYLVDGVVKAYVVSSVGYNGPIEVLVAMDDQVDKLIGIKILNHSETEDYAASIEADWFLSRFQNKGLERYLNVVVLDQENPEDVIQVTGASVSSQAVVNGVNAAIGAYQYRVHQLEFPSVSDVVPQEMWQKDANSFVIQWQGDSIRINAETIKGYTPLEKEVVLINTTGTRTAMSVKGPSLRHILEAEGIDLGKFEGVGITGRDGYYAMIDREKLAANEVILVWEVNGKPLKEDEKPVRIAIANEMGPYWVKMVSVIDLYESITPKAIDKVHLFTPLTQGIEPYFYEYYGSKDASIEVGKILKCFDSVDEKGFFTMGSSDGLIKNETISMVRQRYFIKVAGENAPMNIAPSFKLGMNVKNMTYFSTTKDAVVFPETMKAVVRTKIINGAEGLLLEDVLLTAGMRWAEPPQLIAVDTMGDRVSLAAEELQSYYFVCEGDQTNLYEKDQLLLENLLRIEK